MGDENKFITPGYMLSKFSEMLIKEHGPLAIDELCEELNEQFNAHMSLSSVEYTLPEMYIEAILRQENQFVKDDTGRYHLTSNMTSLEG